MIARGVVLLLWIAGAPAPVRADDEPRPDRTEVGVLPALSYDSDLGFGFGAVGAVARFDEGYEPYRYRVQAQLFMTVHHAPTGGAELPYHDDHLRLDLPGLAGGRLRIQLTAAFTRQVNAGYYGMGNGSERLNALTEDVPRYYEYRRTVPSVQVASRLSLWRTEDLKLDLLVRGQVEYDIVDLYAGSRMAEDLAGANGPASHELLVGAVDHVGVGGSAGLLLDARDQETDPTCCALLELSMLGGAGAGGADGLPFGYGGVKADLRFYAPLLREHLVLASRVVSELYFGRPPFYDLAIGGATTVRGVPGNRFHGRAKLLAGTELRARLVRFPIGSQRFAIGVLAFADIGRVWADYGHHAELDRGVYPVAVGVGGGLRLLWGETFLVRVDVAGSPTEGSTGVYIDIDHVF